MTKIIQGDCREVLKTLPDGSVDCCVTSPPYFGLRSYGTGEENGEIGLEATPEAYVAKLVEVFREVRRVLRADGTLWLNLGDSYVSKPTGSLGNFTGAGQGFGSGHSHQKAALERPDKSGFGIPEKNLIGIPWRVAFALQADGWYLRQDIIWHKPNPMPESVTDRCTKAHEYVFLLSKSERYFFDSEAIKEPSIWADDPRAGFGRLHYRGKREGKPGTGNENFVSITNTRNKRDVWTVTTKPYKGSHFATFPPALIAPMILAGCPVGGTVLDPFGGSGTTGEVSESLGRNSILIELNPDYIELQKKRTAQMGLGL